MDAHWFKKELAGFNKRFQDTDAKVKEQHKMLNSSLLVFKDLDSQVQTLKGIMISAGLMTEAQYEEMVDLRRGLKLLKTGDKIAVGDIVWVDYVAYIGGDKVGADAGLPLRIGSGAINFELALVGHTIGDTVKAEHVVQEEGDWKGKQVDFTIIVQKAKTKIIGEEDATGTESGPTGLRTDGPTDGATVTDIGGRAVQEQQPSEGGDVLAGPTDTHQGGVEPTPQGVEGPGDGGLGHSNASNDIPSQELNQGAQP